MRRDGHSRPSTSRELVPGDSCSSTLGGVVPADVRLLDASDASSATSPCSPASRFPADEVGPPGDRRRELAGHVVVRVHGHGRARRRRRRRRRRHRRAAPSSAGSPPVWVNARRRPSSRSVCGISRCCSSRSPAVLTTSIFVINCPCTTAARRRCCSRSPSRSASPPSSSRRWSPRASRPDRAASPARRCSVKRLVCIEDLGDIEMLLTDKTGTLTEGQISFVRAVDAAGTPAGAGPRLGSGVQRGGSRRRPGRRWQPARRGALGSADRGARPVDDVRRVAIVPFDHERRMVSVLVDDPDGDRTLDHEGRARIRARSVRRREPRSPQGCSTPSSPPVHASWPSAPGARPSSTR